MGFLKHLGIVIASILLFMLLVIGGIFATLNYSLNYENVQPNINPIVNQIVNEQIGINEISSKFNPFIQTACLTNLEIVQKIKGYTLVVPCNVISQGSEILENYVVDYLTTDFYYKEYNCSFVKCFEESEVPLFLVSMHAKNYWQSLFYKTLIISIILSILIIILAEKKSNGFMLVGSLSIISSLIILKLKWAGAMISKAILSPIYQALSNLNLKDLISNIASIFFSESSKVFLWMFISGIILIAIGIILKITNLGIKISQIIENIKNKNKVQELENKTKKLEKQIKQKKK